MSVGVAGIIPVLATPFTSDGEVDIHGFAAIVEWAIRNGAHGIAMFGIASEFYKLTDHERRILTPVLLETARHRVPVLISVTHHSTEIAVRQAMEAEESGADAVMVLPPSFLSPSLDSILLHVEAVVAAVRIPVILQYAPVQTAICAEVLARLPVSIIKVDAAPSIPALLSLPAGVASLVGYMGLDLPDAVSAGCLGCMPTASLARWFVNVWRLLHEDPAEGRREHRALLPLLEYMMQSVEFLIAAEKHLLVRQGVIRSGYCRRPCVLLAGEEIDQLDRRFENL